MVVLFLFSCFYELLTLLGFDLARPGKIVFKMDAWIFLHVFITQFVGPPLWLNIDPVKLKLDSEFPVLPAQRNSIKVLQSSKRNYS